MAQQQALFFDVISSMKKATARQDDASESDNSISGVTNRGNKLKRKAQFVQEGRLAQADGPKVYKRRLVYNGYARNVISQNVAKVDPDGDMIDDDDNSDPELSPAEDDPYIDVKLENLLMPLTSASDLDKHPSLSTTYASRILEGLVQSAQDMVHREENALWRVKQLLVQFRGDDRWAPCGMFEVVTDPLILQNSRGYLSAAQSMDLEANKATEDDVVWEVSSSGRNLSGVEDAVEAASSTADTQSVTASRVSTTGLYHHTVDNGSRSHVPTEQAKNSVPSAATVFRLDDTTENTVLPDIKTVDSEPTISHSASLQEDVSVAQTSQVGFAGAMGEPKPKVKEGIATNDGSQLPDPAATTSSSSNEQLKTAIGTGANLSSTEDSRFGRANTGSQHNGRASGALSSPKETNAEPTPELGSARPVSGASRHNDNVLDGSSETQAHRMTTRARAQASSDPSAPGALNAQQDSGAVPPIHPFFLAPPETLPYRAQGLSPPLSDDVRLVLSAYAQRQEEVVRQSNAVLQGLRKALQLKKSVWNWCRNEGHIGEMSDGEDWIDMEEWGLEEQLRKGEEVEDEEVAVGLTKKTRNRRAVA